MTAKRITAAQFARRYAAVHADLRKTVDAERATALMSALCAMCPPDRPIFGTRRDERAKKSQQYRQQGGA